MGRSLARTVVAVATIAALVICLGRPAAALAFGPAGGPAAACAIAHPAPSSAAASGAGPHRLAFSDTAGRRWG